MNKALRVINIAFLVALIGGVLYGITHLQNIRDYIALRGYEPSAQVISLASDTTMNGKTRNVFYVNHPSLEDKQSFAGSCTQKEQTIVLGCFINNQGIYLLNVTDNRLDGIVEVTAAHEVLHAMYERLSGSERQRVDKMTADFFATLNDDRIKTNIENYRKSDPSVVPNELHSILGTEVRTLSPELEQYYSQYFTNRSAIVTLSEKYEKTFTDIEQKSDQLSQQLTGLKQSIDDLDNQINALGSAIEKQRQTMDSLLRSNKISEYNSKVDSFNRLVNQYNRMIANRQQQALNYNSIVDEYNQLATTETELINQLKTDNYKPIGGAN